MTVADFKNFQKVHSQYALGSLDTESFHSLTNNLSELAINDIEKGFDVLREVDLLMLEKLLQYEYEFDRLKNTIKNCIKKKGRIFLVGCGATGRLSLALEKYWLDILKNDSRNIISLMAGGDVALIHAIEDFEDSMEYAIRTLEEHEFNKNDLMIAITEGGETPYVLSAAFHAASLGAKSFCLFCNPKSQLNGLTKRTTDLINNKNIESIAIEIGPQALSGSTRMQASSCLMLFVGLALANKNYKSSIQSLVSQYKNIDLCKFSVLTMCEADTYLNNGFVNYVCDSDIAIHVLTDTTERAPTFSLTPFENNQSSDSSASLSYLFVRNQTDSSKAWAAVLGREPRCLDWKETKQRTSVDRLLGFDISGNNLCRPSNSIEFSITHERFQFYRFNILNREVRLDLSNDALLSFLLLKMLLNSHSTLLMGRIGRYESNVMTYVKPSNLKLIDRTFRYVKQILKSRGKQVDDGVILKRIFELKSMIPKDQPIVLNVVESLI